MKVNIDAIAIVPALIDNTGKDGSIFVNPALKEMTAIGPSHSMEEDEVMQDDSMQVGDVDAKISNGTSGAVSEEDTETSSRHIGTEEEDCHHEATSLKTGEESNSGKSVTGKFFIQTLDWHFS